MDMAGVSTHVQALKRTKFASNLHPMLTTFLILKIRKQRKWKSISKNQL